MRYRPLGRAVTIALWRANNKPPVELVVANLGESQEMEESIFKLKAAAALLQNMVSTEEEVRYNDLALFYIAKLLYEGIDELEEFSDELKNDKLK